MLGDVILMKIYSLQEIKDLWWKHNNKKCLECDYGEIKHTGSSPNGGWVSYYECESCKTKYEWQDSDMRQTLPDLRSNADENPNLSKELFKQPEIYFNSLGFESCGQYEWKNNIGWVIEYMGTTKRPNCWRIDDFSVEGHQILFIDLKDKKDLEWFLNAVNVNIA